MSLDDKVLGLSFKDILQMDNSNNGIGVTTRTVKDGKGTSSALHISDDVVAIQPKNDDTTTAFAVSTKGGSGIFYCDTSTPRVYALGNDINTQYGCFSVNNTSSANFIVNTHHALPFQSSSYGDVSYPPNFNTNTDPAETFTTSHGNGTKASDIVPCFMNPMNNCTIDGVKCFIGSDTATGDTCRLHLFKYTFQNGSSSCLIDGEVVAYSAEHVNDGDEQVYQLPMTVSSADITSGEIILAFFRSDSINSDYSIKVIVEYHLT